MNNLNSEFERGQEEAKNIFKKAVASNEHNSHFEENELADTKNQKETDFQEKKKIKQEEN